MDKYNHYLLNIKVNQSVLKILFGYLHARWVIFVPNSGCAVSYVLTIVN